MAWYERIISAHRTVTEDVSHGGRMQSDRYFVWQEDGSNDLAANNGHLERVITGATDLYTNVEFDPWVDDIAAAFDFHDIAWSYVGSDYEPETGLFHHYWDWEVF